MRENGKALELIRPPAAGKRRSGCGGRFDRHERDWPLLLFRVRLAWARGKWPQERAAMIDNSPARAIDAQTSASACALPGPESFRMSRQAFCVGSMVPPPTVPTIRLGNVTAVYRPPSEVTSIRVVPTADSATHAASCPQAM